MKKKILLGLLAVIMCFTLVGCGDKENTGGGNSGNGGSEKKENTVKTNWKKAEVDEYFLEDFAELTNNVPEPETKYTINTISVASGLSISFESTSDAEKYKQVIKDNGFTYKDEIYGMESYESKTHEIQFTGAGIIIDVK